MAKAKKTAKKRTARSKNDSVYVRFTDHERGPRVVDRSTFNPGTFSGTLTSEDQYANAPKPAPIPGTPEIAKELAALEARTSEIAVRIANVVERTAGSRSEPYQGADKPTTAEVAAAGHFNGYMAQIRNLSLILTGIENNIGVLQALGL